MKIFNLGSVNIDHVYRLDHFVMPGETIACTSYASFAGGKGFNQTVALARAKASVVHIGAVGEDGKALLETLEREAVDISAIEMVRHVPTGHGIIQVNAEGQNCIIIAAGANAVPTPDSVAKALEAAEPGDILLAQNETTAIADAMRIAHEKGMRVALNPAPMNGRVMTLPLELIDFLIVNEIEGAELLRLRGRVSTLPPEAVLQGLHELFPKAQVVLTLGSEGVMAVDACGRVVKAAAFQVKAVDTTAAGDTFTGFYLASVARGDAMETALRQASAAATISVTRHGASPSVPFLAEVEAWLVGKGNEEGVCR
jgi:ribokinase